MSSSNIQFIGLAPSLTYYPKRNFVTVRNMSILPCVRDDPLTILSLLLVSNSASVELLIGKGLIVGLILNHHLIEFYGYGVPTSTLSTINSLRAAMNELICSKEFIFDKLKGIKSLHHHLFSRERVVSNCDPTGSPWEGVVVSPEVNFESDSSDSDDLFGSLPSRISLSTLTTEPAFQLYTCSLFSAVSVQLAHVS